MLDKVLSHPLVTCWVTLLSSSHGAGQPLAQELCRAPASYHGIGDLLFPQWPSGWGLGSANRAVRGQVSAVRFLSVTPGLLSCS